MRNLYIISHTHWDREWYRPFQAFRLKLVHLIDGMLDLLESDREFKHFMLDGQTIVLDDYLAMRPEMESVLRDHIRKGRILIGPWHILPDMFLVGPESHIRNLLQGDRTARKFGPKMKIGYMPDSFGHIGQIPQILRGFGMETACVWRGVEDGPTEFWWQAPDGSRVLMAYLREGYGNGADLPADNLEVFTKALSEKGDLLAQVSTTSNQLIMYGTDHMEPPRNTSKAIAYADEMLRDTRVIHSTLPAYVDAVQTAIRKQKTELPTVSGELRACRRMHLLPGVLSTRMWIKQRNTASENLLTKWVEPFMTWQELIADRSVTGDLIHHKVGLVRQAWWLLMENHPHDSICGCSIDPVHEEMKVRFDQVDQIGEELTRQTLETLANSMQTESEKGQAALVVFNPLTSSRTDVISVSLVLPPSITEFDLVDENNTPVPYQEQGLGSHEIINMTLDARGLQSAFGNISDGRTIGMTVQDIKVQRDGADVFIDAILADGGEPNLKAWKTNRKLIDDYFADPAITAYHIRARSTSSAQIILPVANVPGHGYRTLWIVPRPVEEKTPIRLSPLIRLLMPLARLPFLQNLATRKHYARPPYKIENPFFTVEVLHDGTLTLLDLSSGVTFSGLNRFQDGGDCGDEYNYAPPDSDKLITPHLKNVQLTRGSVQQVLELELELDTPQALTPDRKSRTMKRATLPIKTTICLTNGVPRLDIHTSVDNLVRDHRLRVHFPAPFAASRGAHDGHFEVVERNVGVPDFDESWVEQPRPEVPQRAFSSISDGEAGLTIANRGLTEVEVIKNSQGNAEIAVTLLRCVGWLSRDDFSTRNGHAGPFLETPGAQMPGTWTFDYSIIPHRGDWHKSFEQAYAFEVPLHGISTSIHEGSLPASGSFLAVEPGTFVVSAVKQSEDGRGWLVRGYNITGENIAVTLQPWKVFKNVERVNLAEENMSTLKPGKEGAVNLPVRGHEIITVLFRE
jgi:mannosylglycerate hydrolase